MNVNNITPILDASATIAPNATIVGDVTIGKNVCIMYGAQIISENAPIEIGDNCIVLENAVLRGTKNFPLTIGSNCLIGPNVHLAGCTIEENVFIATGVSVFHGAVIKSYSEIRINGIVHVNSVIEKYTTVPIGWIAVGNPAQLFAPNQHVEIERIQRKMEFNKTVYGLNQSGNDMAKICSEMGKRLRIHFESYKN